MHPTIACGYAKTKGQVIFADLADVIESLGGILCKIYEEQFIPETWLRADLTNSAQGELTPSWHCTDLFSAGSCLALGQTKQVLAERDLLAC